MNKFLSNDKILYVKCRLTLFDVDYVNVCNGCSCKRKSQRERESVCVWGRQSTLGVKREATDAFGWFISLLYMTLQIVMHASCFFLVACCGDIDTNSYMQQPKCFLAFLCYLTQFFCLILWLLSLCWLSQHVHVYWLVIK